LGEYKRKDSTSHQEVVRLNRYLAMAGVGSRRKNEQLIRSGAVKINGKIVTELATKLVIGKDYVTVNNKPVIIEDKLIYIILNKPKDTITTMRDEKGRRTVMDCVRIKQRVFPVGRLDRNTTGVLLFTNDGKLANKLMHPSTQIEKVYRVTLDKQVKDADLKKLCNGLKLSDGLAKANYAEIIQGSKKKKVLISLFEGRNREVKRMFEAIGYNVCQLDRVSFAGITPFGIPRGQWRFLTTEEIKHLRKITGLSEK